MKPEHERAREIDERATHTPGPWHRNGCGVDLGTTQSIFLNKLGDAQLIASAPTMQLTLQGLADALRDCCDAHELNHPPGSKTIAKAQAALEAARPFLESK